MPISWNSITVVPSDEAIAELRNEWSWLLPIRYQPVLFNALGDMFYETMDGEIWWLNTGTAELSKVATSREEFQTLCGMEVAVDWFLPPLIERLLKAGKSLARGQCYTFVTLPIFLGGTYTVENLNPVDAKEHFGLTALVHKQIRDAKDGDQIRIKIE